MGLRRPGGGNPSSLKMMNNNIACWSTTCVPLKCVASAVVKTLQDVVRSFRSSVRGFQALSYNISIAMVAGKYFTVLKSQLVQRPFPARAQQSWRVD
jgi:hypothetical protein